MNSGSSFLLILSIVLVFSCGTSNEPDPVAPLKDLRSMPEFKGNYKTIARDYYKIIFREDGYPAKNDSGELFDHPIYGAYVINHYIERYKAGEDSLERYIRIVAEASMRRMTKQGDALVMKYPRGYTHSEISGLTQSRYLAQFTKLYSVFGDSSYWHTARGLFHSFLIPIDEGGFYNEFKKGISLEEYPGEPVSYVLNGWLTALQNLHLYGTAISDPLADSIFYQSCLTVAELLPLYDFPEKSNSLYQLTGFQQIMLEFDDRKSISISSINVVFPGYYDYEVSDLKTYSFEAKRTHFIYLEDAEWRNDQLIPLNDQLRFSLIIHLIPYPEPNMLNLVVNATSASDLDLSYAIAEQPPTKAYPTFHSWDKDTTVALKAGKNNITIPLKYSSMRTALMPTSFTKNVNGTFYNAYHFIHIDKLKKLYEVTGIPEFKYWSDKWEGYLPKWKEMPELQDPNISTDPI